MRQLLFLFSFLPFMICCGSHLPAEPSDEVGVSIPFSCTYSGFKVLDGWITVPEEKVEQMEEFGFNIYDYWLECESAIYNELKCSASRVA